jgi:hypothetical protein
MARLRFDVSISLDGFIAGPNQSEEAPGVCHLSYRVVR